MVIVIYSVLVITISIVIFLLQDKINRQQTRLNQDIFHLNQFFSSHNLMTSLARNGSVVSVSDLRGAYIVFHMFRYGSDPKESDLEKINNENEYLAIVNDYLLTNRLVEDFLSRTKKTSKLEIYKTACFIVLIFTQIALIILSHYNLLF